VYANHFNEQITLIHNQHADNIFHDVIPLADDVQYDFTICNPPFFASQEQASANETNTHRVQHATSHELVYEDGGELGFIKRMIEESVTAEWCRRVKWFTCMLGHKSNVQQVRHLLWKTQRVCPNDGIVIRVRCVQQYTFEQGQQSRWGIAWTYQSDVMQEFVDRQKQRQQQNGVS